MQALRRATRQAPTRVTLALEGGGALGAFTWGVLERLLDARSLRIEVVSGASAGAMNAAMLAQGLSGGSVEEAKRCLKAFWRGVALDEPFPIPLTRRLLPSFMESAWQDASLLLCPNFNPLRAIVTGLLDPTALSSAAAPRIVVSATSVRTGKARFFGNSEITPDVLLASSCLPTVFAPVLIDGEAYWDGGFSSNPPLWPLIEAGAPSDIIIIRTAPLERPNAPLTRQDVRERANEIAFGAPLRQELRSLASAQRALRYVPLLPSRLRRLRNARIHMIGADADFSSLPSGSYLDTSWSFFSRMRALGNRTAEAWLETNLPAIGRASTVPASQFAAASVPELALS
jgi:NTE family protein